MMANKPTYTIPPSLRKWNVCVRMPIAHIVGQKVIWVERRWIGTPVIPVAILSGVGEEVAFYVCACIRL